MRKIGLNLTNIILIIVLLAIIVVGIFFSASSRIALAPVNKVSASKLGTTTQSAKVLLGDANSDGVVDITDVIIILRYLADRSTVISLTAADYNKDGRVTQADAEAILQYLFTSGAYSSGTAASSAGSGPFGPGTSGTTPLICSTQFIRGDVNSDGVVNIADAVFMLQDLFVPTFTEIPQCIDAADANDDNVFNIADAVYLLNSLFVPGSAIIPQPYPSAGYDEQGMAGGAGPAWSLLDGIDNDLDGNIDEGEGGGCPIPITTPLPNFEATFGGLGGDNGYSVQQTDDCGYIIGGEAESYSPTFYDVPAYLIKTDSNGNSCSTGDVCSDPVAGTFVRVYNDVGQINRYNIESVQQTSDGGYIVAGSVFGLTPISILPTKSFVIKTDSNGDSCGLGDTDCSDPVAGTFVKIYMDYIFSSVQQTSDGGYIVAGTTLPSTGPSNQAYLIKIDSNGNTLFEQTYGGLGTDTESGKSVQQTSDGGYIVAGYRQSSGSYRKTYIIKTDSNGNSCSTGDVCSDPVAGTFIILYDGGGTNSNEAHSVRQTSDGGYIVAGEDSSYIQAYLIKLDSEGNILFEKTYGGTGGEIAWSAQQTSDGGYIIAGDTTSFGIDYQTYLIKTDSNGNSCSTGEVVCSDTTVGTFVRNYGGTVNRGRSVQQTSDGGYIVGGNRYIAGSFTQVYLIKTDSQGLI